MSTDYELACFTCRRAIHLGQRFTSGWAFGFGTGDSVAQISTGNWIMEHLDRWPAHDVRVLHDAPEDFERDRYDGRGGFVPDVPPFETS